METSTVAKREFIKNAAKSLFFHFGFAKTPMDDIARESNLAKPTLYYYYPNRESISNEIVIDETTQFMNRIIQKIPTKLPVDEKITFFFRTIHQDLKVYWAKLSHLPQFLYEHYPHGRPISERISTLFGEKLKPLLKEGKELGLLDFEDEEGTLSTLIIMTQFLNLDWMRRVPEKDRDNIVETIIHIILNGLRRRQNA
jgi:AcrR family transcriptional regulator